MPEFAKIGGQQMFLLILGTVLMIAVPLLVAIVWTKKKKEKFTTVLIGAAAFFVFVLILEKPLQALLIAPTQMGLPEHALSGFINARPVLFAFIAGLFPGVFEETGRLLAFKTVLKNRKNRETSISYGIGHGGFEVIFLVGITYATYVVYALMINAGAFDIIYQQVMAQAPEQAEALVTVADGIASFSFANLCLSTAERFFAVLFHIGESIIVFYACRDKRSFWLYPFAILIHTAMDFIAVLFTTGVVELPIWAFEGINGIISVLIFCGAYFKLFKQSMPASSEK
ncbi:MAG: YhfC family intramembrane metalloprotease [Lachnospiraceae bacterium]|nr:YhfC family intramembrane metalloprotease [Lachnospiraceae bacterium]